MRNKFFPLIVFLFCCCHSFLFSEEESLTEDEMIAAENSESQFDESLIAAADNLGPTASGYLSEGDFGPDNDDVVEPRVLRDFVESRGLIQCRQKEGTLTLAGDVRARWIAATETLNGVRQRGEGTSTAINRFKSEINLFFDYSAPRAWVSTKIRFTNFDGRDGGTATRVEMDRAFIGYDIFMQGEEDFYIELGRSTMDYLFESRVEFGSLFDGIHFFYTRPIPCVGQFTIHGGPFIIDSFTNHYGWVLETYITKFLGTGWSFKYSIVDWRRDAPTLNYGNIPNISGDIKTRNNPRYQFLVSQLLLGYERSINILKCKKIFIYGAILTNHDARRWAQTNWKRLNGAWYAGFTLGKLCKACDWSLDINYQSVQALAVPEFDLSGIGHGNAANGLLSDAIILNLPLSQVRLFTNYKGVEANALYAMTDSLSLRAKAQYAVPRDKGIGGDDFTYTSFEMAAIFAF